MTHQTLTHIQRAIRNNSLTTVNLVQAFLDRIEETTDHNIYVRVFSDEALERARQIDQMIASGETPGQLFGLVVSVKDVICIEDKEVTAGSKILNGYHTPRDK